jgi:glycosyltransferase involved in cell wall biosynthesis
MTPDSSATITAPQTAHAPGTDAAAAGEEFDLSLLMIVDRPLADLAERLALYWRELAADGRSFETVCVLDGREPAALATLEALRAQGHPIRILAFDRPFGEAAALSVGARHARGRVLLTLPAYTRLGPGGIGRLLAALEGRDMVVGLRTGLVESAFGRLKARVLNGLLRVMLGSPFRDLGSGVRALKREVMEEIAIYGDQHLFLPLLAAEAGFVVEEVAIDQAPSAEESARRPSLRPGRLLDVVAIYFIIRFTRRPFRFFGGAGLAVLVPGLLITLWLVFERLFLGVGLADRPALVLSTLMVVLGFQVIAVGLIGEIIAFTHAKELKDYRVARIWE